MSLKASSSDISKILEKLIIKFLGRNIDIPGKLIYLLKIIDSEPSLFLNSKTSIIIENIPQINQILLLRLQSMKISDSEIVRFSEAFNIFLKHPDGINKM